ncbi:MAG: radical SAM protein [bacterium]
MAKFRLAEHRLIRVDGKEYLFLAADKAIFEVEPPTRAALDAWSRKGEFQADELIGALPGGSADERKECFQGLLTCRAIVPAGEPFQGNRGTQAPQGSFPVKNLILHVTEACNLSCAYCYEQKSVKQNGRPMERRVAQRAVDFLFEHCGNHEEVVLVLFGGEPLLNLDVIRFLTEYAAGKGGEQGKRVNFALTTNGTLLNDKVIDFLHERNIGITVSLDGAEEAHDRYRRFPDGSPSYRVILPKVKRLIEKATTRPVVARVTLVKEAGDLSRTLDHLLGIGFIEAGFAPVTTGHPDYQLDGRQMDLLLEQFRHLSGRLLQAVRERSFFGFSNLIDLLVSLHQGEVMRYPCGAGLGLFSVDADGRLYLCQRFTGQEAFCMGDIFQGFDLEKLQKFRDEAQICNKEECRACWARTLCTGGCYHEACVREGSHLKPNRHYCEWIRRWSELGLETYCRVAAEWPEYLELLCSSRGFGPQPDADKGEGSRTEGLENRNDHG